MVLSTRAASVISAAERVALQAPLQFIAPAVHPSRADLIGRVSLRDSPASEACVIAK